MWTWIALLAQPVLVVFCCCDKHDQKQLETKRGYLTYTSWSLRKIRTGSQAGAEARNLGYLFSIACSTCFLNNSGQPTQGWYCHRSLSPPTSIINKENFPTDIPIGQSDGGNSSGEVPSFWGNTSLYQVNNQDSLSKVYPCQLRPQPHLVVLCLVSKCKHQPGHNSV